MLAPKARAALALVTFAASSRASAHEIAGYAVANHRNCGMSNLPGTIQELEKLFASPYFPSDATKNFFWTDERVRSAEWVKAHDAFPSPEAANGTDGPDGSLITYIATHGTTGTARYTALSGGLSNACYIRSPDMSLGDQRSRYLILSTCQGLKIGTGDDPAQPGENPQITWSNANQGLNCIFGYSNNMVDANDYGAFLLEGLATTDDTLAEAFFKASRRISTHNVPVVMCFGADDDAARDNLATARRFTEDRFGRGGSAYAYEKTAAVSAAFLLPDAKSTAALPRVVKTAPRALDVKKLAKRFAFGKAPAQETSGGVALLRNGTAMLTVDARHNRVAWRRGDLRLDRATKVKDETAVKIARDFVKARGLVADPASELTPTYIVERGTRLGGATPSVVAKTVVLQQKIRGLVPLGGAGSVEVTVDADGQVAAVTASLIDVELLRITEWLDTRQASVQAPKDVAKARVEKRLPGATVTVLDARVGYDVGDTSQMTDRSRLVVEVLLEAEQGGFARRYLEKIPL